jgi:NhaA family Na+:H+ antiporter
MSFLAIQLKVCSLPADLKWSHVVGAAILAGIGFTMSIFVSILAFDDPKLLNFSQIMVLIASVVAAVLGVVWFLIRVPINSHEASQGSRHD